MPAPLDCGRATIMLLVPNPDLQPRTIDSFVETMQVAPTLLSILGLDPNSLQAVQMEGTPVLPWFDLRPLNLWSQRRALS